MKYKAILLDFDGTIVKTSDFIKQFTQEFIDSNNLEYKDPLKLYDEILSNTVTLPESVIENYWKKYKASERNNIELFEGFIEFLTYSKDHQIKIGIVTNRVKESVEGILTEKGVLPMIDVIIGKREVLNKKPHPEPVQKALEALKVQPKDTLFIGNHKEDMETGINAGTDILFFKDNEIYVTTINDWLSKQNPVAITNNYTIITELLAE